MLNDEEVKEILSERMLENFRGGSVWSRGDVIKGSHDLIKIFLGASKDLKREGLVNIDAFAEFSQILFIKIISELHDDGKSIIKPPIHWRDLADKRGEVLMTLYKNVLGEIRQHYPDMFKGTEITRPETLKSVIDRINRYSFIDINADVKGDAYEWFLRRYSKQKSDLGQYFTPRHIVRAMVILCNPRMRETVYDPFCGTGGMLIESFKHISKNFLNDEVNSRENDLLRMETVFGADISRSADAARMNMILAGDGHSNIRQLDSLANPSDKTYDIVITNIPFGVEEIRYIRHCIERVDKSSPAGRLCIIVPERVLDSEQEEYKNLRRDLIKDWEIRRVISLPREVFRGLTSAKTSVIYAFRRERPLNSPKRIKIPYFVVENDGYTLDKKRDPLPGICDLDVLLEDRVSGKRCKNHISEEPSGWIMKPPEKKQVIDFKYPAVALAELVIVVERPVEISADMICREDKMSSETHEISLKEERLGYNVKTKKRYQVEPGDLVFALLHTQDGLFAISREHFHCTNTRLVCKIDKNKVDADYLFWVLEMIVPSLSKIDTIGRESYKKEQILSLRIPLPPIRKQKEMVLDIKRKWDIYRFQAYKEFVESRKYFREEICVSE